MFKRSFGGRRSSKPHTSSYGSSSGSALSRASRTGYSNQPVRNFRRANQAATMSYSELMREVEASRSSHRIQTEPTFNISHRFIDFQIAEQIKKNITEKNYVEPTPIQDQAIPAILNGQDIIGIANTGTGKTAAFLIPLIDKIYRNKSEKVLIVTPTRELAMQIYEEFRAFSKNMGIYAAICIGGANIYRQKIELRKNPHFVIGTPGRIRDFISQKELDMSKFTNVVLDETDRMVDIGFVKEIKYFISLLPQKRQSLFFSATISPKVQEILRTFVTNPVTISVKQQDTACNITQEVIHVAKGAKKVDHLHDLLIQKGFDKVLIFGRTKWGVQKLSEELVMRGFKAAAIHGDKRQSQRLQVLNQFKRDEINILLATDVASRGIDIKDVSHVINYDLPSTRDDYIHRIGRTGRADKKGTALTFIE